jgi:putative transposase
MVLPRPAARITLAAKLEFSSNDRSENREAGHRKGWAMKPSRFSEEQIIAILREQEAGAATADVCRKHGISSATFYKWKAKFGGLEVSDAKRLKTLEDENAKLKKLLAEAMLDNAMLKDVASKKW